MRASSRALSKRSLAIHQAAKVRERGGPDALAERRELAITTLLRILGDEQHQKASTRRMRLIR